VVEGRRPVRRATRGRVADGGGGVGVGEEEAGGGEAVEVGSFDLGVSAEGSGPVVPIVDGDHENIGAAGLRLSECGGGEEGAARHFDR